MLETKQQKASEKNFDSAFERKVIHADVENELQQILASDFFKGSVRCSEFLKHVVHIACSDSPGSLKERTIGIAVFGRAPDYDTGADAIVRVKAAEVRRRLAQYNQSANPMRSVAIELNPGSYTPKITPLSIPDDVFPAESNISAKRSFFFFFSFIAAFSLILGGIWVTHAASPTPLKRFWRPFLGGNKPVICTTAAGTYYLSPEEMTHRGGDSFEVFSMSKNLEALGRSSRIVIANDLTDDDLKSSPTALIGGPKHNRWTKILTGDLRFTFRTINGIPNVIDQNNSARSWNDETASNGKTVEDYVIITRLVATPTHKTVVSIAGLKASGTRLGAELLFRPDFMERMLKFVPEDWDRKNLQLIVRFMPVTADNNYELVAATYW